jgi:hypothetical protein
LAAAKRHHLSTQRAVPYSVHDEFNAYQEVEGLKKALAFAESVLAEKF